MKHPTRFFIVFISFFLSSYLLPAQGRKTVPFNEAWTFTGGSASGLSQTAVIDLPHSWNAKDAQEGIPYYRGVGTYVKTFSADPDWQNQRIFIRFEGVNITSKVVLNGDEIGEHKGGYAAFSYEITSQLNFEGENKIEVTVSNEANSEVIPLVGDFNNYGGIYRPVQLIITPPICITPLDYASPGIYIHQADVSAKSAKVEVLTKFSNGTGQPAQLTYSTTIFDADGAILKSQTNDHEIASENGEAVHTYTLENPHLWNGKKDPYLYQVRVDISQNEVIIDSKTEPLGLRYFRVDPNEGFFLNGNPIDLRGVSRHQDRQDKASAISNADHKEDMDLMLEMGINTLRLAHYQHAEKVYDLTDSSGLVVWAELPWVGMPSGFLAPSNGYENTDAFHQIAKQQLHELIRQNFNHPSILMWSIFNEIQDPEGASPVKFIEELNAIVKAEDSYRLSVGASMLNPMKQPAIHQITDLIAWNRYFGWYYGECAEMGEFLDEVHQTYPEFRIGVSEYGAGGSIYQHSDELYPPNPMGSPHPEEWQSYYHEENLKIFDERPYVWGTFLWNMFDFGSHFRKEGDHAGINDKGMITYDRKTKKDAFYFYKANWSEEPVLHITSSRYIFRKQAETQVKVYTNLENVSLRINDKEFPAKSPEKGIIIWENITLEEGNNGVVVQATKDGKTYTDDCVWIMENQLKGINLFRNIFDFLLVAWKFIIAGALLTSGIWFFGIRKLKKAALWKKIPVWMVFILSLVATLFALFIKIYIPLMMGN